MCEFLNNIDRSYKKTKIYDDYENQNMIVNGSPIQLNRDTLLGMGHRWGAAGSRWLLHSTAKDDRGNYVYNPQDCYDSMSSHFKNPKVQKAVCDEIIKRIIDLNK